jgi:carboxypeptidase T
VVSPYRIRYAWKIEAGGTITYDTVTRYFSPINLLYDDMEGSLSANWTATSNVSDNWAFTTAQKYRGTKSLTESPAGNYTTNTTRTLTYNGSFDLSDGLAAQLSFWAKYRAENHRDKLQVQVSADGLSWTPICGTHTVAELNTTSGGTLGGLPALTGIQDQ